MESESRAHVKPLVFIITYAFGAAKSFAYEIVNVCPGSWKGNYLTEPL